MHHLCPAACKDAAGPPLPWLLLTGAHARAVRAAFSLDVVGGRLYLAAGYGGRDLGLIGDMWALPLPADASQACWMLKPSTAVRGRFPPWNSAPDPDLDDMRPLPVSAEANQARWMLNPGV